MISVFAPILIVLCLSCAYDAKPMPTELERAEMADACIKIVKIDKKIIETAMNTLALPELQKYKDYLFCSYKKQGFQQDDGTFNFDVLNEFLRTIYSPKDTDFIVNDCKAAPANTPSDTSFLTLKCLLKKMLMLEDKHDLTGDNNLISRKTDKNDDSVNSKENEIDDV